jgi:hypothetical protein
VNSADAFGASFFICKTQESCRQQFETIQSALCLPVVNKRRREKNRHCSIAIGHFPEDDPLRLKFHDHDRLRR